VGIELPDLSVYGPKWFTRGNAMDWTDLSYNTVKKHLRQLEEEGLLRSTVAQNNREQGRQIHFQFVDNRAPPFAWKNPFEGLPQLAPPR
jgi:DNA-binding transcriptional ArsR family regulator